MLCTIHHPCDLQQARRVGIYVQRAESCNFERHSAPLLLNHHSNHSPPVGRRYPHLNHACHVSTPPTPFGTKSRSERLPKAPQLCLAVPQNTSEHLVSKTTQCRTSATNQRCATANIMMTLAKTVLYYNRPNTMLTDKMKMADGCTSAG